MALPRNVKLSIIIPCYNETEFVVESIRRAENAVLPEGWTKELILVDDCSTDGTRKKVLRYSDRHTVILHEKNRGKGGALKTGFRKAKGDYITIQDADLEYDPNDYSKMISMLSEDHPVVFGSRVLGKNDRYSFTYFYGSRILTMIFNLLFGAKITDMTTCYKLFPRVVIGRLLQRRDDGFVFDAVYLTYDLLDFSRDIVEVPIRYFPRGREEGKKINWKHGVACLAKMAALFFTKKNLAQAIIRYQQFLRFLIAGAFVYSISLVSFHLYYNVWKIYYLQSSIFAFLSGFLVSFFIQRFWTFKQVSREKIRSQAWQYLLLQLANLCANTALMFVFVEYFRIPAFYSLAIICLLLAMVTYVISKKYIFKK